MINFLIENLPAADYPLSAELTQCLNGVVGDVEGSLLLLRCNALKNTPALSPGGAFYNRMLQTIAGSPRHAALLAIHATPSPYGDAGRLIWESILTSSEAACSVYVNAPAWFLPHEGSHDWDRLMEAMERKETKDE